MKKIVLSFILFSFIGLNGIHAQCTPDPLDTAPGYYPNCATGLPHDTVGHLYSTILQVRVPSTVVYGPFTATVDSFVLKNITGLPAGFSFASNPASKEFLPNSNGCVLISGPALPSIGNYPLVVSLTGYGKVLGNSLSQDSTISCLAITVDAASAVNNLTANKFDLSQNSPNPATGQTDIYYSVPSGQHVDFKMYDLLGKTIYQKSFFAEPGVGRITFDARDYAPGIYTYNFNNGKATLSRRMVITNN